MFSVFTRPMIGWIAGTVLAGFSQAIFAGGLQVSPVSLQIRPTQNAEGIWLTNSGTTPLSAQVRVFQWLQQGGEDLLSPSTNLTVSPPLVEIPAGSRQLVRVLRTGPAPAAGTEATYRLIIDELPNEETEAAPQPASSGDKKSPAVLTMNFLMRYSVPVYIGSASEDQIKAAGSALQFSIEKTSKDWVLLVRNTGAVRAQVADVQAIVGANQALPLREGLLGYVLPGSSMRWSLLVPKLATGQTITGYQAMINSEIQSINVSGTP